MVSRILVFGDSIGQGYYDIENGGWVQLLFRYFMNSGQTELSDVNVINLSVDGHTSRDVIQRLEFELDTLGSGEDILVIIAIGCNDSALLDESMVVPEGDFRDNIAEIIEVSSKRCKVLVLSSTPCVEAHTNPTSWNSKLRFLNKKLQTYDQIKEAEAINAEVEYLSVWDRFSDELQERELLSDGIHPNSDGHRLIFDIVKPVVVRIIENS